MADPPRDADDDRLFVSWRTMLEDSFDGNGEDFSRMQTTLTDDELDERFYIGYGGSNGKPFTAWGDRYVYFPAVYDGSEWVSSAPRNPCDEACAHVGGE